MQLAPVALLLGTVASVSADCGNKEFDQCGGSGWSGETCCPDHVDKCVVVNQYYSQCQPVDLCLNPQYGQCGGVDAKQHPWTPQYHHQTCCPDSFDCVYQSEYYSQCMYNSTGNSTCAEKYEQCGGKDAAGLPWGSKPEEKLCCIPGYECVKTNEYYSGCNPLPICSNARFGQCGGVDADGDPWDKAHGHDICCPDGFTCKYTNQYYSQCVWNTSATDGLASFEATTREDSARSSWVQQLFVRL